MAGPCLFFLVTNFAARAGGSLGPLTPEVLAARYAAAIPFFCVVAASGGHNVLTL